MKKPEFAIYFNSLTHPAREVRATLRISISMVTIGILLFALALFQFLSAQESFLGFTWLASLFFFTGFGIKMGFKIGSKYYLESEPRDPRFARRPANIIETEA